MNFAVQITCLLIVTVHLEVRILVTSNFVWAKSYHNGSKPHSELERICLARFSVTCTLSVGTLLCLYGISYRKGSAPGCRAILDGSFRRQATGWVTRVSLAADSGCYVTNFAPKKTKAFSIGWIQSVTFGRDSAPGCGASLDGSFRLPRDAIQFKPTGLCYTKGESFGLLLS